MNDKLLEVLETLNYPTIIVDSDNTPLWGNRKFLRLQEISREKPGKTALRHKTREVLTEGLRSGELNFEKKGKHHYCQPIRSPCSSLQKMGKTTDVFARRGGEEFAVLLPETSAENAMRFAEHIRTKVETFSFTTAGTVTMSIGITPLHKKEQVDTFLKRLEQALYKAKKEGRNRSFLL